MSEECGYLSPGRHQGKCQAAHIVLVAAVHFQPLLACVEVPKDLYAVKCSGTLRTLSDTQGYGLTNCRSSEPEIRVAPLLGVKATVRS